MRPVNFRFCFSIVIENLLEPFSRDERSGEQETYFSRPEEYGFNSGVVWTLWACGLIKTIRELNTGSCSVCITTNQKKALKKLIR